LRTVFAAFVALGMAAILCPAARAQIADGTVTLIPIATNAYGTDDLNSVGITRDNLVTIDGYQFVAYYQYNSKTSGTIVVGRRATGSTTWSFDTTPYTVKVGTNGVAADSVITSGIDDHDVVEMAVDGNGDMHLSWGLHNEPLNYSISSNSVTGSTFAPTFVKQTATNDPALFSQLGTIDQVTYPEFYYVPNANGTPSGNLLFEYRDAGAASGGGSGNGNNFFSVYNASTKTFADPEEVLNGGLTSVNGYYNSMVYDSNGNLLTSWTWRETPNYQSNQYLLFAQSPDNGATWYQQGGTTQYALPIIASTADGGTAAQVAQIIDNVPQNSSIINQTSMTVDRNNNPVIATWLTPSGNASLPVSSTNNPNRQYVLYYYTGSQWESSQITDRQNDTAFDTSGNDVRDLGRPVVVVDSSNRVIVVTRSEDSGLIGGAIPTTVANNNIVVYWNTMAGLDSSAPPVWQSIPLDTANMGEYEPSYDPMLWQSSNILDLFYEPEGLSNQTTGTAQILQWNEAAYFAGLSNASAWNVNGRGDWNTQSNWNGQIPNGVGLEADLFGVITNPDSLSIDQPITLGTLHFNSAKMYTLAGTGSMTVQVASGSGLIQNDQGAQDVNVPVTFASNSSINVAAGATLVFTSAVTVNPGISVAQTTGGGMVEFQSTATVQSGASLSFGNSSTSNTLNLQSGGSASIAANTGSTVQLNTLTIASGGTMDITNNTLLVNFGSGADPAATIRAYLVSGFNAGGAPWQGTGITSSTAEANPGMFAVGYADGGNATDVANTGVAAGIVEIKYTVAGDANLSGGVDLTDLVIVASDFGETGADWAAGDVNYDGNVDLSDLVIIASNFGASLSSVSSANFSGSFAAEWQLALAEVHGTDVAVPEPATLSLAVICAAGLLARRGMRLVCI
jgi:BNR repeat-containing family member